MPVLVIMISMTHVYMYDRILDFYTFIPFLNTFNWCFQYASAWVTEGLVLKV